MNWKIILLLSLGGVAVAIASVFGLVNTKYEIVYWLVIGAVSGVVIARTCSRALFTHGVMVGLFSGILASVIQVVMFDTYLKNNPTSLDGLKSIPMDMAPQYVLLFSGPFFGIVYGIFVGLIAFFIKKMSGKRN